MQSSPIIACPTDPTHRNLAERVANLAETGDVRSALELLARDGDPAAQADAQVAIGHERNRVRMMRGGLMVMMSAAALLGPAVVADAKPSILTQAKALATPAMKHALLVGQANAQSINGLTVRCSGTSKRVVCVGSGPGVVLGSGTVPLVRATFVVHAGAPSLMKVTLTRDAAAS